MKRYFASASYYLSYQVKEYNKIDFSLGVFTTGYFYGIIDNPSNYYHKTLERNLGLIWGLTPRVVFVKRKRFTMESSLKLSLLDWRYYLYITDDPRVSPVLEEKHNLNWFPKIINFRLGASYLFGKN
ncbi:MAG: hypothetical protein ABJN36_20360 [Cyclobacteriaceae bacterium]